MRFFYFIMKSRRKNSTFHCPGGTARRRRKHFYLTIPCRSLTDLWGRENKKLETFQSFLCEFLIAITWQGGTRARSQWVSKMSTPELRSGFLRTLCSTSGLPERPLKSVGHALLQSLSFTSDCLRRRRCCKCHIPNISTYYAPHSYWF